MAKLFGFTLVVVGIAIGLGAIGNPLRAAMGAVAVVTGAMLLVALRRQR